MKNLSYLFTACCALTIAGTAHAQNIVLDDFEGAGLQGWAVSWENKATVSLGVNPLTGSQCMVITPTVTDFQWAAQRDWPAFNPADGVIQLEVSWVASEWSGLSWLNQELVALNSDGASGWSQTQADDPASPSYPGSWDPSNWGDNTRTLTYDFTSYDLTGNSWGPQMILAVNVDPSYSGQLGNFYVDNIVQLVPEPGTLSLLGLGMGVLLAIRRRQK